MQHMKLIAWNKRKIWKPKPGFLKRDPRPPLGATEQFSGSHEQRPPTWEASRHLEKVQKS